METNFKGTKEEAKIFRKEGSIKFDIFGGLIDVWSNIEYAKSRVVSVKEAEANANLIADAFNVRQQINVDLPELLKQRDELLEVVNELLKDLEFHGYRNSTAIYKANNLITKIEQK